MHVALRIHPTYLVGAGAASAAAAAGALYAWPYVFEAGLLASVVVLGAGLAVGRGQPRLRLASTREMKPSGARTPVRYTSLQGTANPKAGPRAPPAVAPTGTSVDPIPLEILGVETVAEAPPAPEGVPWARANASGPLMFEGSNPAASEENRQAWTAAAPTRHVWAAREAPKPATIEPTGVIHGVCGRCGTRIAVANRRPVWATCPVCGHSKLLN